MNTPCTPNTLGERRTVNGIGLRFCPDLGAHETAIVLDEAPATRVGRVHTIGQGAWIPQVALEAPFRGLLGAFRAEIERVAVAVWYAEREARQS